MGLNFYDYHDFRCELKASEQEATKLKKPSVIEIEMTGPKIRVRQYFQSAPVAFKTCWGQCYIQSCR